MENANDLQDLIDFGIDFLPQMKTFLDNPDVIDESKNLISHNIVLLNGVLQTAIRFQGNAQQKNELTLLLGDILESNYNFLKKITKHE